MSPISRGFHRRPPEGDDQADRLPPGQYPTDGFPVLSAGPTPHTPLDAWTFSVVAGDGGRSWTWDEFRALPSGTVTTDIHCVTRWSKFDTTWQGVSVDTLLDAVEHDAAYVLAFCDGGWLLAECEVYLGGPGAVVRCRACREIVMVLVEVRGVTCVDVTGFERIEIENEPGRPVS